MLKPAKQILVKQKGFSVIEYMVALMIIGIVFYLIVFLYFEVKSDKQAKEILKKILTEQALGAEEVEVYERDEIVKEKIKQQMQLLDFYKKISSKQQKDSESDKIITLKIQDNCRCDCQCD